MKKLLYISSLPQDSQTGGANAVNYHTFRQLQKYFECTYVQINPAVSNYEMWVSKFMRKVLKKRGKFYYFSQSRLKKIQNEFNQIEGQFDLVLFRGFTPWIQCEPKVPYYAYNDVEFMQFFNNTFSTNHFNQKDLQRIYNKEREWLSKAKSVFFESNWGAVQCQLHYRIPSTKAQGIGRGGNMIIPDKDVYKGDLKLLLIANIFKQKGGDLAFEAFQLLKPKYPQLTFHIVGGDPGNAVSQTIGVEYHGRLRKENAYELQQLKELFESAFLLLHPTREDTNPLVITEAGYFGCPAISVDRFAIPELIVQSKTGLLIENLPSSNQLAESIEHLILNSDTYWEMRKNTLRFNQNHFTWERIIKNMANIMCFL